MICNKPFLLKVPLAQWTLCNKFFFVWLNWFMISSHSMFCTRLNLVTLCLGNSMWRENIAGLYSRVFFFYLDVLSWREYRFSILFSTHLLLLVSWKWRQQGLERVAVKNHVQSNLYPYCIQSIVFGFCTMSSMGIEMSKIKLVRTELEYISIMMELKATYEQLGILMANSARNSCRVSGSPIPPLVEKQNYAIFSRWS